MSDKQRYGIPAGARHPLAEDRAGALQVSSVLYVEDDATVREQMEQFLRRRVGTLHVAANGQQGLELWREHRPDIVVTDIMMPVMDGLAMVETIRAAQPDLPVIVTTAYNESDHFLRAIDLGVDKYVVKPIDGAQLERALEKCAWEARANLELQLAATVFEASSNAILLSDAGNRIVAVNAAFTDITGYSEAEALGNTPSLLASGRHDAAFYAVMRRELNNSGRWSGEIWNRRKNGDIYAEWLTINAVHDSSGAVTHYVAIFSDITQRKTAEEEIRHLAFYDPLTRLPNRRLLLDRLHQALAVSTRNDRHGALLFIDLDNFKTLNDTRGHDIGDRLLQLVAERLGDCVRETDTIARLGGDEFVVMLEDMDERPAEAATQAEAAGENIRSALNRPYNLSGKLHHCSPSIGVTLFRGQVTSIEELLKQADLAMYQAKAAGRNAVRFFDPAMQAIVTARSALEADLREALRDRHFILHYQPIVDVAGRRIGMEALVRLRHPQRGLVPPAEFIPLAEETGLILPLGEWVLRQACATLATLGARPETAALTLAVNVSARQFAQPDFAEQVIAALADTGADPHRLKLELTESLLLKDIEHVITKMGVLQAHGVGFSLDDFGTGYSSLAYLKRLPLAQLKIDRSFIRDVLEDANDAAIARTIVALGHSLGLTIVAEGVETEAQRAYLTDLGCDILQGYLFGRPAALEDLLAAPPSVGPA